LKLLKSEQNKLLIFEINILSKIVGPYQDEGYGILDNVLVESEKMTVFNNYVNYQTYWGKLKRNVFTWKNEGALIRKIQDVCPKWKERLRTSKQNMKRSSKECCGKLYT